MKFIFAILMLVALGCNENKGKSIGAPAIEPPVANNTPTGLKSSAGLRQDTQTAIQVLKERLFSPGPTDFTYRLQKIDERMAELNRRSEEQERKCLGDASTEWLPPGTFPVGETFPMYFNCVEKLNENSHLAFGFQGDSFYLAEIQNADPAITVLAKSNAAGTRTEVWQFIGKTEADYSVLHIVGDDTAGLLEVVAGGSSSGLGVGCGIHMRSESGKIKASGIFASPNNPVDETCTGAGNDRAAEEICVQADLGTLTSNECSSISFSLNAITYTDLAAASYHQQTLAMIEAQVTGRTDFNED